LTHLESRGGQLRLLFNLKEFGRRDSKDVFSWCGVVERKGGARLQIVVQGGETKRGSGGGGVEKGKQTGKTWGGRGWRMDEAMSLFIGGKNWKHRTFSNGGESIRFNPEIKGNPEGRRPMDLQQMGGL